MTQSSCEQSLHTPVSAIRARVDLGILSLERICAVVPNSVAVETQRRVAALVRGRRLGKHRHVSSNRSSPKPSRAVLLRSSNNTAAVGRSKYAFFGLTKKYIFLSSMSTKTNFSKKHIESGQKKSCIFLLFNHPQNFFLTVFEKHLGVSSCLSSFVLASV